MPRDDERFGEGEDDATTPVRSLAEHAIVTMIIDFRVRLNEDTETAAKWEAILT